MSRSKKSDVVSFWFWLFAVFVLSLPCIGLVMTLVWAFTGENESRKNFFRALIAWYVIAVAFWVSLVALGFHPQIMTRVRELVN